MKIPGRQNRLTIVSQCILYYFGLSNNTLFHGQLFNSKKISRWIWQTSQVVYLRVLSEIHETGKILSLSFGKFNWTWSLFIVVLSFFFFVNFIMWTFLRVNVWFDNHREKKYIVKAQWAYLKWKEKTTRSNFIVFPKIVWIY